MKKELEGFDSLSKLDLKSIQGGHPHTSDNETKSTKRTMEAGQALDTEVTKDEVIKTYEDDDDS